MQTIPILMLAGTMAVPFQAAEAQPPFGGRLGEADDQATTRKSS